VTKEETRAYMRDYYAKHRKKFAAYRRAYYMENRETQLQHKRERYALDEAYREREKARALRNKRKEREAIEEKSAI
jgi:hypothetical protein